MRRSTGVVAFALTVQLLSGCAIDKGDALAEEFEEDWRGTPDVARVDTHGQKTLPFLGDARGTLVLEDHTPADRVSELTGELRDYLAANGSYTGSIQADDITFSVVEDKGVDITVVALWKSPAADDRVVAGEITDSPRISGHAWGAYVETAEPADAVRVADALVSEGSGYRASPVTYLTVYTTLGVTPEVRVFPGEEPGDLDEALAAYQAVAAEQSVVRATLDHGSVYLSMAAGADLEAARDLAREAAPSLRSVEVAPGIGTATATATATGEAPPP
ncbi:hypothetical protein ABT026_25800 [Streptomyces sp. NPDC002734]|uniref:hypothetical protein n=1 Tax=Streptomyces sp. NPDC002734 TaxID=3154426 RepID=UPI003329F041